MKKLIQSNIEECQAKFNLSYHVNFTHLCEQLVGFADKDVLEVGGSLPKEFVFDYLNVKSWTALESPEYENSIKEVSDCSLASSLGKITDYSNLRFDNKEKELGNYNFYAENIEDLPSNYYNKYDLIFSISVFEHIHKFPAALEKMFLALKPGGQLFAVFSPIWSTHDGHHLPLMTDLQDRSFDFHNSPIPPWGHLLMKPAELCGYLYQFTDKKTADLITYYVYNSPHINRFFTEDYVEFINQSLFSVQKVEAIGLCEIDQVTQKTLEKLYPGRTQFANNGILAVLEKPHYNSGENKKIALSTKTANSQQTNKYKINSFNIITSRQSKPRIDVVLQATGLHGWSFSRGWANVLQREGLLNRVFAPIADWGAEEPKYDDGLFEYLKNPQADIMLMMSFNWHSQPLHNSAKWQERWQQSPITKLGIVQECCSSDVVQNTPEWKQQVSHSINTTIPCVDALLCNHEPDVKFLQKQQNISLPIKFLPKAIDPEHSKIMVPFEQRFNRAVFRGNIAQFFTEKTYSERRKLIEALSHCEEVDLFDFHFNLMQNPLEGVQKYSNELNAYRLNLNLPSMSATLTHRPFEIMACGGVLLQNKIIGEQSNKFFKDWEHLVYYDPQNPDDLMDKIKYLLENPDIAQKIAAQGHKLCHVQHTISNRIASILDLLGYSFETKTNFSESVLMS